MKIIKDKITIGELKEMAGKMFGNLVKSVVDVEKEIMAVDADLHADEQELLIEDEGSKHENLWGVNLYPEIYGDDWIEFDSMINLKPNLSNKSRGVEDPEIKSKIISIVSKLVTGK